MHRILLLAALALLASCEALGLENPPAVLQIDFAGDGSLVVDGRDAVLLGDAEGIVTIRARGTVLPLVSIPFGQAGDYLVVSDILTSPQGHHHAYGSTHVLPARMAGLFTPGLLSKYPLEFAGE